ncbi:flavodoxin family protein [Methanobacterium paludis]|uniref:NADPH-dependent FMN reductase n=1 Tax=Methanobacterium paludis (strain DSM 25820 / JCM 18151 / SWAN1) TaxID=868131 RepID=F6D686_METPW|nr:flavodoxin family protein [Methanobacterium paludis]AEG18299.1 NADPH-dependent FMN reductase [Methanobacterium paludis]
MVKIIGIVGSPRKDGNTAYLVKTALKSAEEMGAATELINIALMDVEPCIACDICKTMGECGIYDDMREVMEKLMDADGIIMGSPVYFGGVTSQMKMLMDRSRPLRIDFKLRNKVGGAIAVGGSRNGGQETTISAIHEFMLIQDMIIVGDGAPLAHYGGTGVGGPKGDTENDDFGVKTSKNLGKRVAELAMKLTD